jgi:hypothetical protein
MIHLYRLLASLVIVLFVIGIGKLTGAIIVSKIERYENETRR